RQKISLYSRDRNSQAQCGFSRNLDEAMHPPRICISMVSALFFRFTKLHPTTKIRVSPAAGSEAEGKESLSMQATAEIIRMMNYVDDIAATLRRISANVTSMTPEERKRLADYMRNSEPNFTKVLESLEKTH